MCDHNRIISISAKCSDLFSASYGDLSIDGYVPEGIGISDDSDYVAFDYCISCGQIQGKFPIPEKNIRKAFKASAVAQ